MREATGFYGARQRAVNAVCAQAHISDKNETSSFSLAPETDFVQALMTSTV